MNKQRVAKLQSKMRDAGLDWLALVPSTSLIYLTGIHSHVSERPFVMFIGANEDPAAIIPALEAMKGEAAGIAPSRIFSWSDQDGYLGAFQQAAQTLNLPAGRIGVESLQMRVLEGDLLHEMGQRAVVHADNILADLRLRKDADEVAAMQKAVDVAEQAMRDFLPTIKIGMTEKEIAANLGLALIGAGADTVSFQPIVSAGPNGASPHAIPTNRPIQSGELLIIDWGAKVGDYVSDITRTFALGKIDAEAHAIYEATKGANAAGVAASRPGATGEEIDKATRDVIEAAGFGAYFIHRTGHGIGLEAHEPPSIVAGMRDGLPVGAAFTVEPGIYLPNKNGVRIEDDVVISAAGHNCLTSFTRELITIG